MDNFLLIAITPESPVPDEAVKIETLLRGGLDFVHLRHPGLSREETGKILSAIDPALRRRVKLHDHHPLAAEYQAGVNFNGRNPYSPTFLPCSISCHSVDEVMEYAPQVDYVMLSPVFDSMSKPGYRSSFSSVEALGELIRPYRVVALGGVSSGRLRRLREAGFSGAAMLGEIRWNDSPDVITQQAHYLSNS